MIFESIIREWHDSKSIDGFVTIDLEFIRKELIEEKLKDENFKSLIADYGIGIIDRLESIGIPIVKAGSLSSVRGKRFEDFITSLIEKTIREKDKTEVFTQVRDTHIAYPSFLKDHNNSGLIPIEIPDIIIRSDNYNAIIHVQIALWGGGQQSNRGSKYHDTRPGSIYHTCIENGWNFHTVVWEEPKKPKRMKSRASKIIENGFKSGIMLYPSTLVKILEGIQ